MTSNRPMVLILALLLAVFFGVAQVEGGATPSGTPSAGEVRQVSAFGEALFEEVRGSQKNAVISPISAYMALALAGAGARGDTGLAFDEALRLPADTRADACRRIAGLLSASGDGFSLSMANSVWLDDLFAAEPDYMAATARDFFVEAFQMDLQSAGALGAINGWTDEKTKGRIPRLLDRVNPGARLMLINALVMDAQWETPFSPEATSESPFTRADGTAVDAAFMYGKSDTRPYIRTDDVEGVLLPYLGGKNALLVVKPIHGGIDSLRLTGDTISGWLRDADVRDDVALALPKFEQTVEIRLPEPLRAMGLSIAFDDARADFSGIGHSPGGPLVISDVLQKVYICVDEKGTKAAAATVIDFVEGAMPLSQPVYVVFDSPFLYAVVNLETRLPVFIGVMDDPT